MATSKKVFSALATGGLLAALGATATPLASVWLHSQADAPAGYTGKPLAPNQMFTQVVVDLRDNVTDADVRDLNATYHLDLQPNSIEARANRLYTYAVAPQTDPNAIVRSLANDPRVEAVEPEEIFSIPEGSSADPEPTGIALAKRDMAMMQNNHVVRVWNGPPSGMMRAIMMPSAQMARTDLMYPGGIQNGNIVRRGEIASLMSLSNPSAAFRIAPASSKPNDPLYDKQWNFPMIGVEDAWAKTKGKGVVVAVIDTGCAIGKSKKGAACQDFADTKITDGYNFVDKNADPYDDHGHGTHVAGTIAESTNNAIGLAGIAPEATIMPLKVLTKEGWGTSADIADAIRYAADHKADVINMSLGSAQSSSVIHNAVKYARKKGVTIVCAAGNGFGEPVGYPAAYPECIAVSSVGPTGNIAFYSSYGKEVALAAPGGDMSNGAQDGIWQNTNYPTDQGGNGDDYYAFQGTSMASPHVAAVAALIESQGVHDPARVREILTQTATPNGEPKKYGAGILSASGAVARADAQNHWKLRHLLMLGLGVLIMTVGGPLRSIRLRAGMAVALGLGFFAPDWWTSMVGADSAWNLLGFSALLPMAAYALLRGGRGVKIAGTFALGVAVCLWANWNNGTLPFTAATFGQAAALPWTFANLGATLAIGAASAYRAFRATNR